MWCCVRIHMQNGCTCRMVVCRYMQIHMHVVLCADTHACGCADTYVVLCVEAEAANALRICSGGWLKADNFISGAHQGAGFNARLICDHISTLLETHNAMVQCRKAAVHQ